MGIKVCLIIVLISCLLIAVSLSNEGSAVRSDQAR